MVAVDNEVDCGAAVCALCGCRAALPERSRTHAPPNTRSLALAAAPQIRRLPKPVVAMVAGYAVGGGHILHMMCDLTIAGALGC